MMVRIGLLLECVWTSIWIVSLVPSLGARDAVQVGVFTARAAIAAFLFAGWWALVRGLPAGARLARMALVASAVVLTIQLGAGVGPTNLDPSFHTTAIAAYWAYAAAGVWVLSRQAPAATAGHDPRRG